MFSNRENQTPGSSRGGPKRTSRITRTPYSDQASDPSDRGHPGANVFSPSSEYEGSMTQDSSIFFSPDTRGSSSTGAYTTYNKSTEDLTDPFSGPSTQARGSLNANASAFKPTMATPEVSTTTYNAGERFGAGYLHEHLASAERIAANELTRSGVFTRESPTTRVIKVVCSAEGAAIPAIMNYLNLMNYRLQGSQSFVPTSEKVVYIRHGHISDAVAVYEVIASAPELGEVSYYGVKALSEVFPHFAGKVTDYEGQMSLTVPYPMNAKTGIAKHSFEARIRELIKSYGSICAFQTLPVPGGDRFSLVAEFADAERVPRAVLRLNNYVTEGVSLAVKAVWPDVRHDPYTYENASSFAGLPDMMGNMSLGEDNSFFGSQSHGNYGTHQQSSSGQVYTGPPGMAMMYSQPGSSQPIFGPIQSANSNHSMVPFSSQMMLVPVSHGLQPLGYAYECDEYDYYEGQVTHSRLRGYRPRGQRRLMGTGDYSDRGYKKSENIVKPERISGGMDVRTTVMLRNIPNRMDQPTLKILIDQTSLGKYDFMYLRIDFSNDCNVGYAFINFLDPLDIIPFLQARANRRWDFPPSDKVAEVSYATIQGRDCLIQKFRNSSVMLEKPECRPKLFYTEGHPRVGDEEPFPQADNQSKLKRSCENAEHVGLFAPAVGQNNRFEQRYRSSQYDRGTSMAAYERGEFDEYENEFGYGFPGNGNGNGYGLGRGSYNGSYRGRGRGGFRGGRGYHGGFIGYPGH